MHFHTPLGVTTMIITLKTSKSNQLGTFHVFSSKDLDNFACNFRKFIITTSGKAQKDSRCYIQQVQDQTQKHRNMLFFQKQGSVNLMRRA